MTGPIVYRYTQGSVPVKERKHLPNGAAYVEWPQCCHMAWIQNVTYSDIHEIAQTMIDHDYGYVGTYLCSVSKKTYGAQSKLTQLGFKKIADILGPDQLPDPTGRVGMYHGQNMEIWMYSMVEHQTYRKMKEAMKDFLKPPEPITTSAFTMSTVVNQL